MGRSGAIRYFLGIFLLFAKNDKIIYFWFENLDDEIAASDEKLTVGFNDLNEEIVGADENAATFDDLTREIDDIEDGGVINLTKDYKYASGSKDGIIINKNIGGITQNEW